MTQDVGPVCDNRISIALLDATKHNGWGLFNKKTTEKLAQKGYFERANHPAYGEQWRITEAGREALKSGQAAQR